MNIVFTCQFCNSIVDDGGYITVDGSRYWIGIVCGCDNKDVKELKASLRSKSSLKVIRK
ncbi:hypothetical protein NVV31_23130 [Cytobacillus firmus]|uniref:hypothetical protein n=1 Tax=Cytobacillus firmus TaxID=1399 RepID=UPI0021CA8142|nr:hypothetical protein [Cytobacillus firmus]MCU1808268.1 hypothetical protein [Cytobacillus firmus]